MTQPLNTHVLEIEDFPESTPVITSYSIHYTKLYESEEVRKLQEMLKLHGFGKYLGTAGIDGQFGTGTRKGVEEYSYNFV